MALYCGIDLHSNNHVVVVIDEADRRVVEKRVPNDLAVTRKLLEPYREALAKALRWDRRSTGTGWWMDCRRRAIGCTW